MHGHSWYDYGPLGPCRTRIGSCLRVWNEEKRFFTIPKNISQNYIMADFTAMVVGGAHFDNSCFISTPSSGIFVQNESVVTKSYVQLILDTLYKINKTDIDKKMGKYIIAYYNIVNYLYQITLDYQALHPSIHGYITSINSYMHSQGYGIDKYTDKMLEYKWDKSIKERKIYRTLDDIKSFKYDANNGMKWSVEEKTSFEKLSHVDKKKYLINKMGFKGGVIFPNLSPESLYKYPEIRQGDDTIAVRSI